MLRTEDQKYVFNGDNEMSDSGVYEAAGAVFDYHRLDSLQEQSEGVTEWVTCTGPIRESLELMVRFELRSLFNTFSNIIVFILCRSIVKLLILVLNMNTCYLSLRIRKRMRSLWKQMAS